MSVRRRTLLSASLAGVIGLGVGAAVGFSFGQTGGPQTTTVTVHQTITKTITSTPTLEKQTIKIGEVPAIAIAPLYIAIEKGLFEKEGLVPELTPVPAGSGPSIEAILSGNVDVSSVDYASVMKLAETRGIYLKVVHNLYASGDYRGRSTPPDSGPSLIVPKNTVKKISELKGKTIAVNALQALPHMVVTILLKRAGLDPYKDVNYVEIPFNQMLPAVASRRVDAALMIEPFSTAAVLQGIGEPLIDPPAIPQANVYPIALGNPVLVAAYFTTEQNIAQQRNKIAAFARVVAEGVRHLYGDIEESVRILAKSFKLDAKLIEAALKGAVFAPDPNGFKDYKLLEPQMRSLVEAGYLTKTIDVSMFATDFSQP